MFSLLWLRFTLSGFCFDPFILFFPSLFSFFGSTQGLLLAGQVLSHLNHDASPFCFRYFFKQVLTFMPGLPWTTTLIYASPVTGMTGTYYNTQLFIG
jgi:hypothetical protein